MLSLLITIVGCKKTTTSPNKTSNNTSQTSLGTYSGTFVNTADITDQITLTKTTNSINGETRYTIFPYYKYDKFATNHDTINESDLTTNPYHYTSVPPSGTGSNVLYASSPIVLKVQMNPSGNIITFNKQ